MMARRATVAASGNGYRRLPWIWSRSPGCGCCGPPPKAGRRGSRRPAGPPPRSPALPDGTRRVDYIPGPQAVTRRQLGLPRSRPQRPALRQRLRPRRRVDGPVHPGAAQQRGIGRVDNGLRVRTGDISHQNGKAIHSRPPVPLCRPDISSLNSISPAGKKASPDPGLSRVASCGIICP